jgi:hypothetical protein
MLLKYTKKEYGSYDIKGIPAIDKGLIYFAVNGNTGQLKNIKDIVYYFKELQSYQANVEIAFTIRDLAPNIYQYVKANPGCSLRDLKKNLHFDNGRLISDTVKYMKNASKLSVIKVDKELVLNVR